MLAAVITSYFPDPEFLARVQTVASQVDHVLVVDNTDGLQLVDFPDWVKLIRNKLCGYAGSIKGASLACSKFGLHKCPFFLSRCASTSGRYE